MGGKKNDSRMILIPIAAAMVCIAIGLLAYLKLKDTGNSGAGIPKEQAASSSEVNVEEENYKGGKR